LYALTQLLGKNGHIRQETDAEDLLCSVISVSLFKILWRPQ